MQQGVTCWSYFRVPKIWSSAMKIIYQIFFYNPNRDHEKTFRNLRLWGPSEIHRPPSWLFVPWTDVPAEPLSHRPWTSPLFALFTCCWMSFEAVLGNSFWSDTDSGSNKAFNFWETWCISSRWPVVGRTRFNFQSTNSFTSFINVINLIALEQ
jgi:hypothetical protein